MAKNKYEYEIGKVYGCKQLLELNMVSGRLLATVECVHCHRRSEVRPHSLFDSRFTSCTCMIMSVNGLSNKRIYAIYHNMLYRCNTATAPAYPRYGGRGIKVCEQWSGDNGFENFYNWSMTHGYTDEMTIDRIDNNSDYSPDNCQWISKSENTARANKTTQRRKADRGTYRAIDPDGNVYTFDNASLFCKEHDELRASSVRRAANNSGHYHNWLFGFTCEPQSTIENAQ